MKIKLAVLENDKSYLERIVSTFETKYADKLEIYSFTEQQVAMQTLDPAKIDVLLASDSFEINVNQLPRRCAFAYLVDSLEIESFNDQRAICKFQKADLIYKQILSVYSEKASSITGFKMTGEECRVIAFGAAGGGVGASTMAAACAVHLAARKKKVLYLNLERFGSADLFFDGQGQFDLSDIIFALKSKKTNLPLKLESCVRQATNGVYYYAGSKVVLDRMELNTEEILRLIAELKLTGEYEYMILDLDFGIDGETLKLYRQAQSVVLVGDGTEPSNNKTERAYAALTILEQNSDAPLTNRMAFLYNKVSSKGGQMLGVTGLKVLGGAPRYTGATVRQITEQLSQMAFFDSIL